MIIGVLHEPSQETRVALVPDEVEKLRQLGVEAIWVESGAGQGAFYSDADYRAKGAELRDRSDILAQSDLVIGIFPPKAEELDALRPEAVLIGQFDPLRHKDWLDLLVSKNLTSFSMDLIPRTTRAQSMDVLSSQASVAGYIAVLLAGSLLPRFMPLMMTAAGTIKPAKVLVLGAGVAGLQAIATARRLGATVEAFDVRKAAKEEVLSLGAKFIEVEGARDEEAAGGYAVEQSEDFLRRQKAMVQAHASRADILITTAQIPGRPAPKLVTEDTVRNMPKGAVIVDMAAATGGNCALTEDGKTVTVDGVTIIGDSYLPRRLPQDASRMYSRNIFAFLKLLISDGTLHLNFEDDIVQATCTTHKGKVISPRVRQFHQIV